MNGYSVVKVRAGENAPHYIPHLEGVMDRLFFERIQNRHFSSKRWGRKCSLLTSRLRGCFFNPVSQSDTGLSLFPKRLQGSCPSLYWKLRGVFTNPVLETSITFFKASVRKRKCFHCIGHLEGCFISLILKVHQTITFHKVAGKTAPYCIGQLARVSGGLFWKSL